MAKESNLVEVVKDKEYIARKSGETDADVKARYARQQQLENKKSGLSNKLKNYDEKSGTGDVFEKAVKSTLSAIPREITRRKYKSTEAELSKERGYKGGGSVSKRADGCAMKGKTKGKMV